MRSIRWILVWSVALGGLFGSCANGGVAGEPVKMATYVVQESSAPAFLKIGFKHHLFWAGLKSLTFDSVPAQWARMGVARGDRVLEIDGEVVDGLSMRKLLRLMINKFAPLKAHKVKTVMFRFRLLHTADQSVREINVIVRSDLAFTVGT